MRGRCNNSGGEEGFLPALWWKVKGYVKGYFDFWGVIGAWTRKLASAAQGGRTVKDIIVSKCISKR